MARPKKNDGKLSVFKGREAKLNRVIFHALATKEPQTIYDIHKQIRTLKGLRHTKYTNVSRRVRALEEAYYLDREASETPKQAPRQRFNACDKSTNCPLARQDQSRCVRSESRRRHTNRRASCSNPLPEGTLKKDNAQSFTLPFMKRLQYPMIFS